MGIYGLDHSVSLLFSPLCRDAHTLPASSFWNVLKSFKMENPGHKLTVLEICLLDISFCQFSCQGNYWRVYSRSSKCSVSI